MNWLRVAVCFAAMVIPTSGNTEQSDHSANYYLPACRAFVRRQFADNPFGQGECVGIIEALAVTASDLDPKAFVVRRSCAPNDQWYQ
jgi:hypothetical protein